MTFFHFANCAALAFIPYFLTFRYSGMYEYTSYWKCAQAGIGYFLTQLLKMLMLATFFPTTELEGIRFDPMIEFVKCTADVIDIVGLYLIIHRGLSGKGEIRFLIGGLGWAAADVLATRLYPLWTGARGIEFDWKYVQMSVESNVNLIHFMTLATLIWVWNRSDLPQNLSSIAAGLLIYSAYRQFLFSLLLNVFGVASWSLLLVKMVVTIVVGILALNLYYAKQQTTANGL